MAVCALWFSRQEKLPPRESWEMLGLEWDSRSSGGFWRGAALPSYLGWMCALWCPLFRAVEGPVSYKGSVWPGDMEAVLSTPLSRGGHVSAALQLSLPPSGQWGR